jgi:hypothetical protein
MALLRRRAGAPRPWTEALVYHYSPQLGLTRVGSLLSGSKEVIRAKVTGTEIDPTRVGAPGDGVLTAETIAGFLNEIYGIPTLEATKTVG